MPLRKPLSICLLTSLLFISGCASDGPTLLNPFASSQERQLEKLDAAQLYRSGRTSLDSGDARAALEFYRRLEARYPFSSYATQAQLETIYAHYRAFENEQALLAASRFIKEYPRHPEIDYVYYLRGVIYQESIDQNLEALLQMDSTKRSPQAAKQAFEAFALLLQRYPASPYSQDARQRMVWLRDRLATHELYVAEYYLRRKAYVAATRRCQVILEKYQGTDSIPRALQIMAESYSALGLTELANNARAIYQHNYPKGDQVAHRESNGKWWWPFN